ncbi:spore germination protein [Agathobaculum sp.]|uniref:spore germination protein n=1 Tax=Agathobaculum sp. TaxID=2048138 RepID=UPI002A835589|nr:spore germination protein [Agathobaculum sp.]MDY3617417.1 spore germination protein [Agathobaculum sp.]
MDEIVFSTDLEHNIRLMQDLFQGDNTMVVRRAQSPKGLTCAAFFFDGMVNAIAINQSVIRPIVSSERKRATAEELAQTILQVNDSRVETDLSKLFASFLYGDTVVFTEGDARPVVVNTKGFAMRSTSEPENERVLSGPREGFTECFMPNLALIRRRLNDKRLKFTFLRIGSRTNTVVCLCYLQGVCEEKLVKAIQKRLSKHAPDSILDSNYLAERIRDHRASPFPTMGTTERPDVVAARLVEGRCAIVVDGSPVVLTAPYLLQECFQSNDDYYVSYLQANISRLLRLFGFFFSICVPAVYIALMLYHRELVPARLLFAVSAAQRGVPLPAGWETFLMLLVLEALKEAGARTPGAIGQTMSIVGGLVLGQAAVSARFAAAPTVIVVAIAGVTGLMVPKLQTAVLYLRFLLLAAAAAYGLYGVAIALALILAWLCNMRSFSVPYLLNLVPRVGIEHEDAYLRAPWFIMRHDRFPVKKEDKR